MSLALHSSVDGDQDDEVQSEEFSIHADKGEELEEDNSFGTVTYSQDLNDPFIPTSRTKSRSKTNKESLDKKKLATKIWIKNVVSKKEDQEENNQIGVGREYLFVAYVCTFKHNAITPGVFWTIFTELFSEMNKMNKNPRVKLTRQTETEIVFPGMKKDQIPCHQDERFRYIPGCEMKSFNWGTEWKMENQNDARIIESIFGQEGPPPLSIDEIRNYFMRRRDHEFEAFYNPWNPAANPRPKRPEYQQEHIAAKRKRERVTELVEEDSQLNNPFKYDIWENSKQYFVAFDAPGVDPNEIQVELFPNYLKVLFPRFHYEQTFIHSHPDFNLLHSSRGFNQDGDKPAIFIIPLPGQISVSNKEHRHVENENGTVRMKILKDLSYADTSPLVSHDE